MPDITTALSKNFKIELLKGNHDLANDEIRISLIKFGHSGDYDADTTSWQTVETASDFTTGAGYSTNAGGTNQPYNTFATGARAVAESTFPKIEAGSTTAIMDFTDATFHTVTVQADGCVMYNASYNAASDDNIIAIFDFGGTVSSTQGNFTIQFPAPGASTSILRLA
tara:strand:+ start:360 stop:863 length:504 start_codon:yes stop_codon:yes gene_type:complete